MKRTVPLKVLAPLVTGLLLSITLMIVAEIGHRRLEAANATVRSGLEIEGTLRELLELIANAESGERGYLLTGRMEYLKPYQEAVGRMNPVSDRLLSAVTAAGNSEQRAAVTRLLSLADRRRAKMEATLAIYRVSGADAALELMHTDLSKRTMDELREVAEGLLRTGQVDLATARIAWQRDLDQLRLGMRALTGVTIVLLLIIWLLSGRELGLREQARQTLDDNQRKLATEVESRTAELSELSAHLQETSEQEKTRLARELHDELGSLLVSAKMDVSWAQARITDADPDAAARLTRALETLDEGVSVKRRFIEDLRPTLLDNLGLAAAVEWQARETCDRAGLKCLLELDEELMLPPDVSIALYRIVQESLTNVVKYAQAGHVEIHLAADASSVSLSVADDGIGISEGALHSRLSHGILGMRQRARALGGELKVSGGSGRGTCVSVRIPVQRAPARASHAV